MGNVHLLMNLVGCHFTLCLYDYEVSSLSSFRVWGLQSTGYGQQRSTHSPYGPGRFCRKKNSTRDVFRVNEPSFFNEFLFLLAVCCPSLNRMFNTSRLKTSEDEIYWSRTIFFPWLCRDFFQSQWWIIETFKMSEWLVCDLYIRFLLTLQEESQGS